MPETGEPRHPSSFWSGKSAPFSLKRTSKFAYFRSTIIARTFKTFHAATIYRVADADPLLSPSPPCSLVCWCSLSTRLLPSERHSLEFPVDEMFDLRTVPRLVLKDRRSWWVAVVYSGLRSFED
jgi:hypothetical protein